MSEQKKGKRKAQTSAIVATVIAAASAIAAIVVLLVILNKHDTPKLPDGTEVTFKPTQELADECGVAAQILIQNNYKTVRLFVSEGLPHLDEPYGHRPEDGLYTVKSDRYSSYEEIEAFVKSVYTEKEAQRILTQMPSDPSKQLNGEDGEDVALIAVYGTREIFVDIPAEAPSEPESSDEEDGAWDGGEDDEESSQYSAPHYVKQSALGISDLFKPYTAYSKPWGSISVKVMPISEEECQVTVYLGADKDVNLSSVDEPDILTTKMVKENGEWRLESLIY